MNHKFIARSFLRQVKCFDQEYSHRISFDHHDWTEVSAATAAGDAICDQLLGLERDGPGKIAIIPERAEFNPVDAINKNGKLNK